MYEVCVSLGCVTSLAQLLLVYFLILSPVIALISHEQCCFRPCQRCSVWFKDATVRERENQGLWEVDCETETGLAGCKSWPCGRGGGGGRSDGFLEVELLSLGFLEQMRGVSFISESRSDSLCLCFLCVCVSSVCVCGKQERRYLVIFFCCGFVLLYRCC